MTGDAATGGAVQRLRRRRVGAGRRRRAASRSSDEAARSPNQVLDCRRRLGPHRRSRPSGAAWSPSPSSRPSCSSGRRSSTSGQQLVNGVLAAGGVGLRRLARSSSRGDSIAYWARRRRASVLGVLLVIPIGGADMPVVIALLTPTRASRPRPRLRPRQQRADHRRLAGRRVRHHPHADHVQGDEPLAGQRALRQARRRTSGGRQRRRASTPARSRRPRPTRSRCCSTAPAGRRRAGLRHGRRAGPARGARPGQPARGAGHRSSSTRSTRWPAGCPDT